MARKVDYSVPNAYCEALPDNIIIDTIFGETIIVSKSDENTAFAYENGDECDMYTVHHSGFNHIWSSSVVMASVAANATN